MNKFIILLFCTTSLFAGRHAITVHGFISHPIMMTRIKSNLEKEGFDVVNWSYKTRRKTIEDHGADLVVKLQEMAKEHPNEPIDFVTHSMGGLVIRAALNHPDCPQEAKSGKAVTVAPPHRGSKVGRKFGHWAFWRRRAGRFAGNELLTTEKDGFDRLGQFPESVKVMVIAGSMDGKVAPHETRLKTPHEYKEVTAPHTWIMFHNGVVKETVAFLTSDPEIPAK